MRPRLLDLFAGEGGAAMGYHRAGFDVVGVDVADHSKRYPSEFHRADALDVLDWLGTFGHVFGRSFDAVHASPPCQAYSNLADNDRHPALVPEVRELLRATGLPYVIENVVGAPLENPIMLCGSSFGLGVRRHRLFESNVSMMGVPCAHGIQEPKYRVYQRGRWYLSPVAHVWGSGGGKARDQWGEAMGIDWMTDRGLAESIPPVFTEHVGHYLMAEVSRGELAA